MVAEESGVPTKGALALLGIVGLFVADVVYWIWVFSIPFNFLFSDRTVNVHDDGRAQREEARI